MHFHNLIQFLIAHPTPIYAYCLHLDKYSYFAYKTSALVPVIYTDHVPAAFSAMNKLVIVTFPFPQLTVCVSPLGLVIVRLFANIAPFPPITDAFEQSISTSFTIALSGKLLKLNVMVLEFQVTPGNNATDIAFDDVTVFDDVVAAKAVT